MFFMQYPYKRISKAILLVVGWKEKGKAPLEVLCNEFR